VANDKTQAIPIRQIALVMRRKTAGGGAVGEFSTTGVEVAFRKGAFALTPRVFGPFPFAPSVNAYCPKLLA